MRNEHDMNHHRKQFQQVMSLNSARSFELKGVENYCGWKDYKQAALIGKDLWNVVSKDFEELEFSDDEIEEELPEVNEILIRYIEKPLIEQLPITENMKDVNALRAVEEKNFQIHLKNRDIQYENAKEKARIASYNEVIIKRKELKKAKLEAKEKRRLEKRKMKIDKKNAEAAGLILSTVSPMITKGMADEVKLCGRKLWLELEKRYSGKNAVNVHSLKSKFFAAYQYDNETMSDWINRLDSMRLQMVVIGGESLTDSDMITKLLANSNRHNYVITQRESDNNDLEKLKKSLLDAESFRRHTQKREERVNKINEKKKPLCFNCGEIGHMRGVCKKRQISFEDLEEKKRDFYGANYKPNRKSNDIHWNKNDRINMVRDVEGNYFNEKILIDTGATVHCSGYREVLHEMIQYEMSTKVAGINEKAVLEAQGEGTIKFSMKIGDISRNFSCNGVKYVPGLDGIILSVSMLEDIGVIVNTTERMISQEINGRQVQVGKIVRKGNLYYLDTTINQDRVMKLSVPDKKTLIDWHRSFGHVNTQRTKRILDESGIKYEDTKEKCQDCILTKIESRKFGKPMDEVTRPLELVSADLFYVNKPTYDDKTYGSIYVDKFSGLWYFEAIKSKSDQIDVFKKLIPLLERQSGYQMKKLNVDSGGEYTNKELKLFLEERGIQLQTTIPDTPQMNGSAERLVKTITTLANACLSGSGLTDEYWADACEYVTFIQNRLPREALGWKSPYQVMFGGSHLGIEKFAKFGQLCIAHQPPSPGKRYPKFENRGIQGRFIGWDDDRKMKILIENEDDWKIIYSRTIEFLPEVNTGTRTRTTLSDVDEEMEINDYDDDYDKLNKDDIEFSPIQGEIVEELRLNGRKISKDQRSEVNGKESIDEEETIEEKSAEEDITEEELHDGESRTIEEEFQRIVEDTVNNQGIVEQRITRSMKRSRQSDDTGSDGEEGIEKKKHRIYTLERIFKIMIKEGYIVDTELAEPKNYREAVKEELWKKSVKEELKSFIINDVFKLCWKPEDRKKLPRWKYVFKNKMDSDGEVERHKTRMVLRGDTQTYGMDYKETFAPVINKTSVRLLLTIAAIRDLDLQHYDIKTAFLVPEIKFKQYAHVPEGMLEELPELIKELEDEGSLGEEKLKDWKLWLKKLENDGNVKYKMAVDMLSAAYGSKQGAHDWNEHFDKSVIEIFGYTPLEVEPCVYVRKEEDGTTSLLGLYTDDIIHAPGNQKEKTRFKALLEKHYKITDKGELKWFIGFRVTRDRSKLEIYIDQESAIRKLIEDYGMDNATTKYTPMIENIEFMKRPMNERKVDAKRYRSLLGSLIYYMTGTRPDLSFAISKLAQYMTDPYESHMNALMRVLRYLKGTLEYKLRLGSKNNEGLVAYADADWAADKEDRKSMLGYVIKFHNSTIGWKTRKQQTVALSTVESELYSLSATIQESLWIKYFLKKIGIELDKVIINEDNTGTISLAKNKRKDGRTKHVDIKHYFITDKIKEGLVDLRYLKTEEQLADTMTKPLGRVKFEKFREDMGIVKLPTEGECET